MCGMAGIICLKQNVKINWKNIDGMLARMKHRGPDDSGVCGVATDGGILSIDSLTDLERMGGLKAVLGFNRLSIQDLSAAGHQPMISADQRVVMTFNGEIYNVESLRKIIKEKNQKIQFTGTSDTEVILCLYQRFGFEQMVKMLNGMFVIVLYDASKDKIYIARDRFGIIPLHLWIQDDKLAWASEIKAFLELQDFKRSIELEAFSRSFLYCYPNDSLYQEVSVMEPATYMEIDMGAEKIHSKIVQFYAIKGENEYRIGDEKDFAMLFDELLSACVARQLISDVPVGVQFSGGVDSTLLAKYVSDIFVRNGLREPYGFSLVNRTYQTYSEEKWIDYAASKIAIRSEKFDMDNRTFFQNFEKSVYAYERMINIPSPIGIYEFAKHAREKITVLLSGEGADEVCGGYGSFAIWKALEWVKLPRIKRLPVKFDGKLISAEDNFLIGFDRQTVPELCKRLFPAYDCGDILEERKEYWRNLKGSNFTKARQLYFRYELISLLERQNKICMAHSVENRVPFLDNEVVDFMFSIPESYLLHNSLEKIWKKRQLKPGLAYEGKYLLKQLSATIYGEDFAYRNKQAIRLPLAEYIQDKYFHEYLEEMIIPGMKARGYIHMDFFNFLYHHMEKPENTLLVWKAINFEVWNQLFVDGRLPISG